MAQISNSIGSVTMSETTRGYATTVEGLVIAAQAAAEQVRPGQSARFHHGAHVFLAQKIEDDRLVVLILEPGGASHSILANAIAWSVETIWMEEREAAETVLEHMSPNGLVDFHKQVCLECP
jgi:hypothetical protein